jgi:hypothetical protein
MKNFLFITMLLLSAITASAADWYLSSAAGNDANSGANWANAKATLTNVLFNMAAGETCYATNGHTETIAAAITLSNLQSTAANPIKIISVSDDGVPPTTVSAGASFGISGNNAITIKDFICWYGWTFQGSLSANAASDISIGATTPWFAVLDNCQVRVNGNSTGAALSVGSQGGSDDDQLLLMLNTSLSFSNTSSSVFVFAQLRWLETPANAVLGTIPTTLFTPMNASSGGRSEIIGVDLSALGSGKNLVSVTPGIPQTYYFQDCKLGSSVSVTTGTVPGQGGVEVMLVNCDSADTNYRFHRQTYTGSITHETTNIKTNGATDGTTPISRKMVSTANSSFIFPLSTDPIEFWNETTNTAQTVTLNLMTDGVLLSNTLAWVSLDYLGQSGFPISSNVTSRAVAILTAPTILSTNATAAWNTNGIVAPVWQTVSVNFTPQMKGLVKAKVALARPSTTIYADLLARTPSARQYQSGPGYVNEGSRQTAIGFSQ